MTFQVDSGNIPAVSQVALMVDDRVGDFVSIVDVLDGAVWPSTAAATPAPSVARLPYADEKAFDELERTLASDPGAMLIVVYQRPAALIAADIEEGDLEAALDNWVVETGRIMSAYRRHRRQVVLLEGYASVSNTNALTTQIRARLGCELNQGLVQPQHSTGKHLAELIAEHAVRTHSEAGRLAAELLAASLPIPSKSPVSPDDLLREWKEGRMAGSEKGALKDENELFLLQLHQIQDELEHYVLAHEKAEGTIKELSRKIRESEEESTGLRQALEWKLREIEALKDSRSWKVTSPLRKIVSVLRPDK